MLVKKLQDAQLKALKGGDKTHLEILRYILAQIQNKEIAKKDELTDEEAIAVLKKIVKELKESIEASKKGERDDLIKNYQNQLNVVEEYLPAEISDEELKQKVTDIIAKNKELYDKNPKTLIGICVKELRAQADPSRIMKIVSEYETS